MSTLKEVLAQHAKLIVEAQETLGRERIKSPAADSSLGAKEAALQEWKKRAANLTAARAESVRNFDARLADYQKQIATLEKQMAGDRSQAGGQPAPARRRSAKTASKH